MSFLAPSPPTPVIIQPAPPPEPPQAAAPPPPPDPKPPLDVPEPDPELSEPEPTAPGQSEESQEEIEQAVRDEQARQAEATTRRSTILTDGGLADVRNPQQRASAGGRTGEPPDRGVLRGRRRSTLLGLG